MNSIDSYEETRVYTTRTHQLLMNVPDEGGPTTMEVLCNVWRRYKTKHDTHTALLINIEPIEKPKDEVEHEMVR